MKLILVTLCCLAALAAAEVKWSEDGQYRLIDDGHTKYWYINDGAPVPVSYRMYTMPSDLRWSEDGRYELIAEQPEEYREKVEELREKEEEYVKLESPALESYRVFPMPSEVKWSEDGRYRLVAEDPLLYRYVYPMPYRSVMLPRAKPFTYSYKQIST